MSFTHDEYGMRPWASVVLLLFLSIVIIGGGAMLACSLIGPQECAAKWGDSGMPIRWSLLGDCQVQQKDGTWITTDVYLTLNRHLELKEAK